jgi:hypothetical protein
VPPCQVSALQEQHEALLGELEAAECEWEESGRGMQTLMRARRDVTATSAALSALLRGGMTPEQRAWEAALRGQLADRESELRRVTAQLLEASSESPLTVEQSQDTSDGRPGLVSATPAAGRSELSADAAREVESSSPASLGSCSNGGSNSALADALRQRLRALLQERDAALAATAAAQETKRSRDLEGQVTHRAKVAASI